jgi:Rrf2 family cysteine metabolism transcriptional repressor
MRISTRSRYGLRAMLELCRAYGEGPVTAKSISAREEISMPYLEHLLASLRQAGLVRSVRGPGGGFELATPPDEISLLSIIRALDGPVVLCDCFETSDGKLPCGKLDSCSARALWEELSASIEKALEATKLKTICGAVRE